MRTTKHLKASTLFEVLVALSLVALVFSLGSKIFINIQSRSPQLQIIKAADVAFRSVLEKGTAESPDPENGMLVINEEILSNKDFPDLQEVHTIVKDSLTQRTLAEIKYLRK